MLQFAESSMLIKNFKSDNIDSSFKIGKVSDIIDALRYLWILLMLAASLGEKCRYLKLLISGSIHIKSQKSLLMNRAGLLHLTLSKGIPSWALEILKRLIYSLDRAVEVSLCIQSGSLKRICTVV